MLRASNLAPADTNGRSDPYCIVSVGQRTVQTSVQTGTLNPEWMQAMVFFSSDLEPFALIQGESTLTNNPPFIMCVPPLSLSQRQ